jgi:hypothetical protein
MTLHLHLQIAGALLLALGLAHVFFNRYFGWDQELASVSLFTRRVFQVHCFFIALVLVLLGAGSLFYADALLDPTPLSRLVLAGIVVFWLCRLFAQFFFYDQAIWKGDPFRTSMHWAFSTLWIYLVVIYVFALARAYISHVNLNFAFQFIPVFARGL